MATTRSHRLTASLASTGTTLWVVAVLAFGLGDLATTGIGLALPGVVEANPVAAALVRWATLWAVVPAKVAVLGGGYLLWRRVPRPYCVGVPIGLAAVGVAVTAWNLHVLVRAGLP